ncbi:MAG: serine/threonine protein kinase [Candidatus Obscuribacterales bacterium]|nr:serine/threonine protein kinase [Candidatus Obscuribacterales bacterium]
MPKSSQSTTEIRLIKVCPLCHRKFHAATPVTKCPEDNSTLTPMKAPLTRKTIAARYQLQSEISSNRWSEVFLAKDIFTGRPVVLRIFQLSFEADAPRGSRFRREADAVKRLRHARIVRTLDFGIAGDGRPYLVMECAEGENLKDSMVKNRFTDLNCARLMIQLADALSCAHRQGIIHGDIKPTNIMIAAPNGDHPRATFLGFGVAKILASEEIEDAPRTHQVMVNPAYMSPEQFLGRKLNAASDVYSLGCVFYEMLSGRPVIRSTNAIDCLNWHLHRRVPPLAVTTRDAAELEKITRFMLERSTPDRYNDIEEVKADLQRFFNKKSIKGPGKKLPLHTKILSKPKLMILALALALASLASWMCAASSKRTPPHLSRSPQSLCIKPASHGS